ncbi:MAG: sulfurtransferase [Caldilineaceae bacterium]
MPYMTLISTEELAPHIGDPDWALIDCRFKLDNPAAGRELYKEAHIPGAVYAHLDEDLSGPIVPGKTGRHPLPSMADFVETLSNWGIDERTQIVAYDDNSGVYGGRLWWMLRWMGHYNVAVLNGDFRAWQQEDRPTASGVESRARRRFLSYPQDQMQVNVADILANIESGTYQLFDVRDESRFRGEVAGMDPVAGHIPGAKSAYYAHNLAADGKFKSPEELRVRYSALLGDKKPEETIFYCGSGVSLHHDLLALEHAGFGPGARVYIGSWSGWIVDPARPVATGE